MPRALIFAIFLIGLGIIIWFIKPDTKNIPDIKNVTGSLNPTPTPFEHKEMTIPFLRSREYKSTLSELSLLSSTSSYNSYLTSYTSDGLRINALLTKPTGNSPEGGWPAIIFIHGYIPPSQYQTTTRYVDHIDYLARNGFVVFKIDLRGHGDSEGEPGGAYYSSDYIIDALNAYAALDSTDFVNKIGFWGHSMAGNVVLRSLAAKPEIPAASIWAGAVFSYTDREKYGISDNSYRPPELSQQRQRTRQRITESYGEASSNHPFLKEVVPTNYLNDLKGSIQLNHAIDDNVVNIGYSRDLDNLLDKTTVAHELNEYSSGGHNITGGSFTQAMQKTVEFFSKYLK